METIYNIQTWYNHRVLKGLVILIIPFLLFACSSVYAQQTDSIGIYQLSKMSLRELLDLTVISPTQVSQKMSEAPAIISVITANQINERGYRSVGEALQSVAGIDPLS